MDILIITRFCLDGDIEYYDINNIYLRLYLLETFALPSVINQTDDSFKWIIIINKRLPSIVQRRIKYISNKYKNIHYKYENNEDITDIEFYLDYLDFWNEDLLTISLDDDNAISPDYVSFIKGAVKAYLKSKNVGVLSFSTGFVWYPSNKYLDGSMVPVNLKWHNAGLSSFQKKDKFKKVVTYFVNEDIEKKLENIPKSTYYSTKSKSMMYIIAKHYKRKDRLYSCNRYKRYYNFFLGDKTDGLIRLNQIIRFRKIS